jgi:hypothetical protein
MYLKMRFMFLQAATRELRAAHRDVWRWFWWALRCSCWALVFDLRIAAFMFLTIFVGWVTPSPDFVVFLTNLSRYLPPVFWVCLLFCTSNVFFTELPRVERENEPCILFSSP